MAEALDHGVKPFFFHKCFLIINYVYIKSDIFI